jgi:hypothetical protein
MVSAERNRPDRSRCGIVVDLDATIVEKAAKR